MSADLHRCHTCGLKHRHPKAHRAVTTLARGGTFTTVEVLAALALDGWLALALWLMVAWNVVTMSLFVVGLAMLATDSETGR